MKEFVKTFLSYPGNLILLLCLALTYTLLLFSSSLITKICKIKLFKEVLLYTIILCSFPVSLGGFSPAFIDRWSRYGGTITSFVITGLLNFFFFYLLNKAGFIDLHLSWKLFSKQYLLIALSTLIGFSVFWSEDPMVTLIASTGFFFTLFCAIQLAHNLSWKDLERLLRLGLTAISLLSLMISFAAPSLLTYDSGVGGFIGGAGTAYFSIGWGGLIGGVKSFTVISALLAVLWLRNWLRIKKGKTISALFFIFFLLFVLAGNSVAGAITFLSCLYALFLTSFPYFWKRRQGLFLLSILILVTTPICLVFIFNFSDIAIFFGKDPTLTGRTLIWDRLLEKVNEHNFLLGYGYNGFWQPWKGSANPAASLIIIVDDPTNVPTHAHNGFFEVIVQLGYVGFAIFIFLFLKTFYKTVSLLYVTEVTGYGLPFILIIFLLFSNLAETMTLGLIGPNFSWLILAIIIVKPGYRRKDIYCTQVGSRLPMIYES